MCIQYTGYRVQCLYIQAVYRYSVYTLTPVQLYKKDTQYNHIVQEGTRRSWRSERQERSNFTRNVRTLRGTFGKFGKFGKFFFIFF
eukprot:COSAG01_NODE_820_length_13331_cov_12.238171_10_plen_86_part_00